MRSLLIALMVLIIVAAALLGWALYNIDTIIAWNKERIIAAAARRTGRNIDFDRVHVKLRGGTQVRILGLRLGQAEFSGSGVIESFSPLVVAYDMRTPRLRFADLQLEPADGLLEEVHASGRLTWSGGLAGDGTLTASRGKLLGLDYTELSATVDVAERWLVLESLRLKVLDGALEANGRAQLRDPPFPFKAALRVRGIDIGGYLEGVVGLPRVEGTLEGELDVTGEGRTWDAIKPTLAGAGKAAVLGGRVLEFHLAEQALEGITGVQGLGRLFSRGLKERYPHIFERGTTVLEQLDGEFKATGGEVVIDRFTLKAKDYGVTSHGSVDFDGFTEVDGMLTLSRELSADLLPPARLGIPSNDQGEVELSFAVDGTLPHVRVRPGSELVVRLLQGGVGARGLRIFRRND